MNRRELIVMILGAPLAAKLGLKPKLFEWERVPPQVRLTEGINQYINHNSWGSAQPTEQDFIKFFEIALGSERPEKVMFLSEKGLDFILELESLDEDK